MTVLSELYQQTFQLNILLGQLKSQLYNCNDTRKKSLLINQEKIWYNKLDQLKKEIDGYIKH